MLIIVQYIIQVIWGIYVDYIACYISDIHVRAVRIRAALLMRTEAESERVESEGRSRTQEWVSDREHAEG